jgi:hypothetical protein
MTEPTSLPTDGQAPVPASMLAATPCEPADALPTAEWGYEAADPALQARLWGEPQTRFDDR